MIISIVTDNDRDKRNKHKNSVENAYRRSPDGEKQSIIIL